VSVGGGWQWMGVVESVGSASGCKVQGVDESKGEHGAGGK
jgi:hypothetical protein